MNQNRQTELPSPIFFKIQEITTWYNSTSKDIS